MAKLATVVINGKNLKNLHNQKAYDFELGMKHQGEELYKVYINHDPGMTLVYFTARST